MARKFSLLLVLLVLLAGGCAGVVPGFVTGGGKLRVLVLKGADEAAIRGAMGGDVELRRSPAGVVTSNGEVVSLPRRFYPRGRSIELDGRPYRGVLEVSADDKGLLVVNEIGVERYLVGIINNEISSKWPVEAIKAQAVAARTYAAYQKRKRAGRFYHIEGSVLGQVYSGTSAEDSAALRAVRQTRGEILVYGGEPALAVYHSNAGGRTEASVDVWGKAYPYLRSVDSPYDRGDPRYVWEFTIPADTLAGLLARAGFRIGLPEAVVPDVVTRTGRVKTVSIRDSYNRGVSLRGEDLRRIIGYSTLRSTLFEVTQSGYLFIFKGRGSGHGVGLSQWGAKGMAEDGYGYREILAHYYPGTRLKKGW